MISRNRLVYLSFILISLILPHGVSHAAATLPPRVRWIQSPLFSQPAIVLRGGVLTVHTRLPGGAAPRELRLIRGGYEKVLPIKSDAKPIGDEASPRFLIPSDTPVGLYDIELLYGDAAHAVRDDQPRAVDVLPEFPSRFKFAVVSDIHYGDIRAVIRGTSDINGVRARVLDAVGRAAPEFVLFTGDLTFAPFSFQSDYPRAWEEFFRRVPEPLFPAPGNHDMYRAGFGGKEMGDGAQYWRDTFGAAWHSFDFGKWHFVSLNTYDWPAKYRSAGDQKTMRAAGSLTEGVIGDEQWNWLREDLARAHRAGRYIVVFGHHPPDTFTMGPLANTPGFHAARDLSALFRSARVRYYLCGHTHVNSESDWVGVRVITTVTAGSDTSEPYWGYREFEAFPDGRLSSRPVPVVQNSGTAKTEETK